MRHALDARSRLAAAATCAALVAAASPVAAGDVAFGEYLAGECVTCHQVDGADKGIPSIVGWEAGHFVAVLQSYKSKERPNQVMQTIAGRLSDADMAALAAYFETLKPRPQGSVANAQ